MATEPPVDAGTTYVVCEGRSDATLVWRLLVPLFDQERVRLLAANGVSMAVQLARTLLTTTPARVAVVADAAGRYPIRGDIEMALGDVAFRPRWEVFIFEPSVERLVADDPAAVAAILGRPLSEAEGAVLAVDPAACLKSLAASRSQDYVAFVDQLARRLAGDQARGGEPMRSLVAFLNTAATAPLAHAG